jgi:hypothetical protein
MRVKLVKKLFSPDNSLPWMQDYAQIPYGLVDGNSLYVYFSSRSKRDAGGNFKSYTGLVCFDLLDNFRLNFISQNPIIGLGVKDSFDEFGVMPGSVIKHSANSFEMFYCGWSRPKTKPYQWSIGSATSNDGLSFSRNSPYPLTLSEDEDLTACPMVYKGEIVKMYYLSSESWIKHKGKFESVYLITEANHYQSETWVSSKNYIIPKTYELECQTSPSLFLKDGCKTMLYSYRHAVNFRDDPQQNYRTAWAVETSDGKWEKKGDVVFEHENEERTDIAYANVVNYLGINYVLYNLAQGFGTSGIFLGVID